MFRSAFERRRCIVPVDAFYEWRPAVDCGQKQPFAIARADGETMALAGLWEGWQAATGKVIRSFAIITTTANRTMAPIHDRMPVVLSKSDWPQWMGEADGDLAGLMTPCSDDVLRVWPVSSDVNSPRHNRPELLLPADPTTGHETA
jgi:putative SOS response-associated peptidase YedK